MGVNSTPLQSWLCNRECLRGFVTQYLDAMVAHKLDSLPLAAGARFTEDTRTMKLGVAASQVTRSRAEGAIFNIDAIQTPRAAMNLTPEKAQLDSREEAIRIAELYPAGLKVGSFVEVNAPFAADAYRIENGTVTAGQGCRRAGCENPETQTIMKHPAITTRVIAVEAFTRVMPANTPSGWD